MTVAGAMVFEAGPGTSYDAVAERVAARLHLVPRYRQRLEEAPMGLANPVWVDDEGFDLHWHLRHATLPAPGGARASSATTSRARCRASSTARGRCGSCT